MDKQFDSGLMWFRRDLRVTDNAALCQALGACRQLHCVFVFDRDILEPLPRFDRRVEFIRESLCELDETLRQLGGKAGAGLIVRHAVASEEIVTLATALQVQVVFAAHDYEPQALVRDEKVKAALTRSGIALHTCKDHVIFEGREILTKAGTPYGVFTPYKNTWLATLGPQHLRSHDSAPMAQALAPRPEGLQQAVPTLAAIGFDKTNLSQLKIPTGAAGAAQLFEDFFERLDSYHETRDFPAVKGPSYLSVHLRFGTVSIRQLVATAWQRQIQGSRGAAVWLGELIWRDFYFSILANFPRVAQGAFKAEYDAIQWEQGPHADALFQAWCEGRTGYPLVDAAMAQINQSGYMHNRLRMVVGSFLVKDLGIDWRWGEKYFAQQLNDFDLAANNGGWQWVSSSGCDAQPYFRIFNPVSQSEKFDAEGKFIRRYVPQLAGLPNKAIHAPWNAKALELQMARVTLGQNYPAPIVAHDAARALTLQRYATIRKHPPAR
ncbi:MAG: DNA photolyase family protein [Gammaproteobacteria bacterium]|uniref:cryptochrome/photolyase family protein n=1 Tax=Rhodoferax sp. TaxID=50421 RepID=UPI0017EA0DE9|nr:deoxyribodipyrimidine photo-lyase [Rhodoferax sp.]MBU3897816.1 DNA photolyase family protein [Gammaproteobacteria bacterium]MBA3056506.1 deoxyribodipyrimidine photo-lyase [Rhodoferax sp.]MBU3996945.1 DNA photolyase family protein [Gammaproteobacteria bacterium]MBU4017891.1 DNA photolyase family protein [Gammaproteobacteria bacterium]MBU4078654.1 DNA photolyase family protein [Gammaproteobacteria bacterium]